MNETEFKYFFIDFVLKDITDKFTYRLCDSEFKKIRDTLCNNDIKRTIPTDKVLTFQTSDDLTVIINLSFLIYANFFWEPIKSYVVDANVDLNYGDVKMFFEGANNSLIVGVGNQLQIVDFIEGLTSYSEATGFSFLKDKDDELISVNLNRLKILEIHTTFLSECEKTFANKITEEFNE